MCTFCGNNKPVLKVNIIDNNGNIEYCPNCLLYRVLNNLVDFDPNLNFIDDITNKPGAIKYDAFAECYILNKETLIRLITHSLTKDEYHILYNKYGNRYMLHDDFYDENGNALLNTW